MINLFVYAQALGGMFALNIGLVIVFLPIYLFVAYIWFDWRRRSKNE